MMNLKALFRFPNIWALVAICLASVSCSPIKLAEKGHKLEQKNSYQKAATKYAKALQKDPNSGLANYGIAKSDLQKQTYRDSVRALQKINRALQDDELSNKKGIWYAKHYTHVLKDRASIHLTMARQAYRKGEYAKSLSELKKTLRDFPDHSAALQLQTKALFEYAGEKGKLGKYEEAISLYDQVLRNAPNHSRAKVNKVEIQTEYAERLIQKEAYSKAIQVLKDVLKVDPSHSGALSLQRDIQYIQASKLANRREYPQAIELLSDLLRRDPQHHNAKALRQKLRYRYAEQLQAKGEFGQAISQADQILAEVPSHTAARQLKGVLAFALAKQLYQDDQAQQSLQWLEIAEKLVPELAAPVRLRKGWALFELGQISKAISTTSSLQYEFQYADTATYYLAKYYAGQNTVRGKNQALQLLDQFYDKHYNSFDHFRFIAREETAFSSLLEEFRFHNWLNKQIRITISDLKGRDIPDLDLFSNISDPMVTLTYKGVVIASSGYNDRFQDKVNIDWPVSASTIDFDVDSEIRVHVQDNDGDFKPLETIVKFSLNRRDLLPGNHLSYESSHGNRMRFGYTIRYNQAELYTPGEVPLVNNTALYFELTGCLGWEATQTLFELSPYGLYWDIFSVLNESVGSDFDVDWSTLSYEGFMVGLEEASGLTKLGKKLNPVRKLYKLFEGGKGMFDCYKAFNVKYQMATLPAQAPQGSGK